MSPSPVRPPLAQLWGKWIFDFAQHVVSKQIHAPPPACGQKSVATAACDAELSVCWTLPLYGPTWVLQIANGEQSLVLTVSDLLTHLRPNHDVMCGCNLNHDAMCGWVQMGEPDPRECTLQCPLAACYRCCRAMRAQREQHQHEAWSMARGPVSIPALQRVSPTTCVITLRNSLPDILPRPSSSSTCTTKRKQHRHRHHTRHDIQNEAVTFLLCIPPRITRVTSCSQTPPGSTVNANNGPREQWQQHWRQ